jgi:dolichol-phosphate mannosyltransferase
LHTDFLLAIPVYNEERHLAGVLAKARRLIDRILVVDDGSTDATPHLLADQPVTAIIRHPDNLGYGASLASAFDFASRYGYRWLITMDCDEQHEPSRIPAFVAAARADEYDIVSGSRYLAASDQVSEPPADRRRINRRITRMLNERLDLSLTDAFCGFKAYRVASLAMLNITEYGYAMPLQLWVQAARAGLRTTELAVRLIYHDPDRHFGGSLDDPQLRYDHYVSVFEAEMAACGLAEPPAVACDAATWTI